MEHELDLINKTNVKENSAFSGLLSKTNIISKKPIGHILALQYAGKFLACNKNRVRLNYLKSLSVWIN